MADRLDLQSKLEGLLGNRNVYFNPPTSLKMQYDCIRYKRLAPDVKYANDIRYKTMDRYELILIGKSSENPVIKKLLELPYCSYDRNYTADNLHHDVFILYH